MYHLLRSFELDNKDNILFLRRHPDKLTGQCNHNSRQDFDESEWKLQEHCHHSTHRRGLVFLVRKQDLLGFPSKLQGPCCSLVVCIQELVHISFSDFEESLQALLELFFEPWKEKSIEHSNFGFSTLVDKIKICILTLQNTWKNIVCFSFLVFVKIKIKLPFQVPFLTFTP